MSPSVERTCGCWEFTLTFESLAGVKRGEVYFLSSAVMSIEKTIIVFELVLRTCVYPEKKNSEMP